LVATPNIKITGGSPMSIINKALASIGIGATKIDTRLSQPSYRAGEAMNGTVVIKGGTVDQEVDEIFLTLLTSYTRESNDKAYEDLAQIIKFKVSEPFKVMQNEIIEIPFSFDLPHSTPITTNVTKIWLKTGADIKHAVDPRDEDSVIIKPSIFMSEIIEHILSIGFVLRNANCFEAPSRFKKNHPFVQEFIFEPSTGPYYGLLDELEIIFFAESEEVYELLIEVDRKNGLGNSALLMDDDHFESIVRKRLRKDEISDFSEKLEQIIKQYS